MGLDSAIGWCTHTWNPWQGCIKVSPGCKFCYMYRDKARYGQDPTKVVRSKTTFRDPLKWNDPAFVFTCSWSDFFIAEADEWRGDAWNIIRQTPHLTYQILTKRPERIIDHLPSDWGEGWPNVWVGVSAENQATADERIPELLRIPAAMRWVSAEPLLGDVNLLNAMCGYDKQGYRKPLLTNTKLDWVVIGGESGPERRDMDMAAFTSVVEQCQRGNVPVFVKQDSALHSGRQGRIPDALWLKQFPRIEQPSTIAGA